MESMPDAASTGALAQRLLTPLGSEALVRVHTVHCRRRGDEDLSPGYWLAISVLSHPADEVLL